MGKERKEVNDCVEGLGFRIISYTKELSRTGPPFSDFSMVRLTLGVMVARCVLVLFFLSTYFSIDREDDIPRRRPP